MIFILVYIFSFCSFFIVIKPTLPPCFNINSAINECLICAFDQSLDNNIFLQRPYPFLISECNQKLTNFYSKNILILSENHDSSIDLSNFTGNIYPNISKAFVQEQLSMNLYSFGIINFYLLGNDFYLLRTELLYSDFELFRRSNISLQITPLYCDLYYIQGCFSKDNGHKPIIHIKTNEFYIFVSNSLFIENVIFDGNDIIIQRGNDELACYNNAIDICCSYNDLINKSNITCFMNEMNYEFKNESLGLFNLEQIIDDKSSIFPMILMKNCEFKNFLLLKSNGFSNIITCLTAGNITMMNVSFHDNFINYNFFNILKIEYDKFLINYVGKYDIQENSLMITLNTVQFVNINNQNLFNNSFSFIIIDLCHTVIQIDKCSLINMNIDSFIEIYMFSSLNISRTLFKNIISNDFIIMQLNEIMLFEVIFKNLLIGQYFIYSTSSVFIEMSSVILIQINSYYSIFQLIQDSNSNISINSIEIKNISSCFFNFGSSSVSIQNMTIDIYNENPISFIQSTQCLLNLTNIFINDYLNSYYESEYFIETYSSNWTLSFLYFTNLKISSIFFLNSDTFYLKHSIFINMTNVKNIFVRDINYYKILIYKCTILNSSLNSLIDSVRKNVNQVISLTIHETTIENVLILGNYILRVCCCNINITSTLFRNVIISHESIVICLIYLDYKTNILIKDSMFINSGFTLEPQIILFGYDYTLIFSMNTQALTFVNNTFQINHNVSLKGGFLISNALGTTTIIINNCSFSAINKNPDFTYRGLLIRYAKLISMQNNVFINLNCPTNFSSFLHQNGIISLMTSDGYAFNYVNKNVIFINNTFYNCSCSIGGSINLINYHNIFFSDCRFYNSSAKLGSHIAIFSSTNVVFCNLFFYLSFADKGSAIYVEQVIHFSAHDLIVSKSISLSEGAIYLSNIGKALFIDTHFYECISMLDAGTIYGYSTNLIIKSSMFYNSSSYNNGGAIFIENSQENYFENLIFNQSKSFYGGALNLENISKVFLKKIIIIFSFAEVRGGALYLSKINSLFCCELFIKKTETSSTGIIYMNNIVQSNVCFIKKLYCIENRALKGSCLFYNSQSNVIITTSYLSHNLGSVLYFPFNNFIQIILHSLTIQNNTCTDNLLYGTFLNITIFNCFFVRNGLLQYLISLEYSTFFLIKSSFFDKLIGPNDGLDSQLVDFHFSSMIFQNITIKNFSAHNFVSGESGYLFIIDADLSQFESFQNSMIEVGEMNLTIANSKFLNNKGTIIKAHNSEILILNSIFVRDYQDLDKNYIDINLIQDDKRYDIIKQILIIGTSFYNSSGSLISSFMDDQYDSVFIKDVVFIGTPSLNDNYMFTSMRLSNFLKILIFNTNFKNLIGIDGAALNFYNVINALPIILINNSIFENCVSENGGAIFITSLTQIQILNTKFLNNMAREFINSPYYAGIGATIFYNIDSSSTNNSFMVYMNSSLFYNNYATKYGSTIISNIFFNYPRKSMIFLNNSDGYNISRLPIIFPKNIQIKEFQSYPNSKPYEIISGFPFNISFNINDMNKQNLLFDNASQAVFLHSSSVQQIFMDNQVSKAEKGVFTFNNMIIKTNSNLTLNLKMEIKFENTFAGIIQQPVSISKTKEFFVKACVRGEIINKDLSCSYCNVGTYSLIYPMDTKEDSSIFQKCKQCPENAICLGGSSIYPLQNYWRLNENSSKILNCIIPDTCLGYNNESNFTNEELLIGPCIEGHQGNLCFDCSLNYGKLVNIMICKKCEDLQVMAIVSFILVIGIMFFYILFMSVVFLKNEKIQKERSSFFLIFLKILLNHMQELSLMTSIHVKWPFYQLYFIDQYKEYFAFLEPDFFLNSCVFGWMKIDKNREKIFTIKKTILSIFPALMSLLVMLAFLLKIVFFSKKCNCKQIYQNIRKKFFVRAQVSFLIAFFIFYPIILRNSFDLLNCFSLNEDSSLTSLYCYPDMICWQSEHLKLVYWIAIPSMIFWGFFIPIMMFYRLKLRKELKILFLMTSKKYKNSQSKRYLVGKYLEQEIENELYGARNHDDISITYKKDESTSNDFSKKIDHPLNSSLKVLNTEIALNNESVSSLRKISHLNISKHKAENLNMNRSIKVKYSNKKQQQLESNFNFENNITRKLGKNKKFLSKFSPDIKKSKTKIKASTVFSFFSNGYKDHLNYWEFINFIRKFYLISVVSLNQLIHYSTVCILVLVMVFFHFTLQMKCKPYRLESFNFLQLFSIMCNFYTIMAITFISFQINKTYQYFSSAAAICLALFHIGFLILSILTVIKQKKLKSALRTFNLNL